MKKFGGFESLMHGRNEERGNGVGYDTYVEVYCCLLLYCNIVFSSVVSLLTIYNTTNHSL